MSIQLTAIANLVDAASVRFGGYHNVTPIAGGNSGHAFRATEASSGRTVFIKTIAEHAQREFLLAEFAALRRIAHRTLPVVIEIGVTDDATPFVVTEWIDGTTLSQQVIGADEANEFVIRLLHDVGYALAAIHRSGNVHGDVAPQNIVVSEQRATLVDLGFVTGIATRTGGRGTPATMAPECFAGFADPRSDLYSLGMTAVFAVRGAFAVQASNAGELAAQVLAGVTLPALPELMPGLVDLLRRLTARAPSMRPAAATEMLSELRHLAAIAAVALPWEPTSGGWTRQALACFGRDQQLRALTDWLASPPSLLALCAPSSRDSQGMLEAATTTHSITCVEAGLAPVIMRAGSYRDFQTWLQVDTVAALADALANASGVHVVLLHRDDHSDGLAAALLLRTLRGHVLLAVEAPLVINVPTIELPRLDATQLGQLCLRVIGHAATMPWLFELAQQCDGSALAAYDVLQAVPAQAPYSVAAHSVRGPELEAAAHTQIATLSASLRRLLLRIALAGGRIDVAQAITPTPSGYDHQHALSRDEVAEILNGHSRGAPGLHRDGRWLQISPSWRDVLLADAATLVPDAAAIIMQALHMAATATDIAPDVVADMMVALPAQVREPDRVLAIATEQLAHGRPAVVRALCEPLAGNPDADLLHAQAALALGDYPTALTYADAAKQFEQHRRAAALVCATVQQRQGQLADALATLATLHVQFPDDDTIRGGYARAAIAAGHYQTALTVATPAAWRDARCAESAGLTEYYIGNLDAAAAWFDQLTQLATATADQHALARASALHGMVAQQRGDLRNAAERYAATVALAQAAGQLHLAATAQSNLGSVLCDRGFYAGALAHFADAIRTFTRLGAGPEIAAAQANRANALLGLGELDRAAAALAQLRAQLDVPPHIAAFCDILDGDALALRGDTLAAATRYRAARDGAAERNDDRAALAAELALFEAVGGEPSAAVQAAAQRADADGGRARLALARAAINGPAALRQRHAVAANAVAEQAIAEGRVERSFRAFAVAAQLWRGLDEGEARAAVTGARQHLNVLLAETPTALADRWHNDRDAVGLPAPPMTPTQPESQLVSTADRSETQWLRRLLALSRRLSSEPLLARILDDALDTAVEICRAERGFVLLRSGDDFVVSVARGFAAEGMTNRDFSTQIARQAATTGEPVITIDAGTDARFDASQSIAALRLRSVLAVPLRFRGTTLGCVYIDHRLRDGAFDEEAVLRLRELADIAALAIGNAQLSADIAGLNRLLADELAIRERELATARAPRPNSRVTGRFPEIIGESEALTTMLSVIERASTTALPVVIVGESGTGKELVARALHQHGARCHGPFVAVNCGALPDTLLESELFGHARGAFTGALRDRAGLFEQAHGGTLFLDEIADTSLAMQTKLLRVLQDGSLRRLGDQQSRTVDVRIVAATQTPLSDLVAAGRFRDDLRFRLDVIAITVPPLRERIADILPLAKFFAARYAATGIAPEFTRACERTLVAHAWPGNIRELENAIARAIAMGSAIIDRSDLPPALNATKPGLGQGGLTVGDDLRLRPVLNATESAYIEAALNRTGGNHSAAAKLLGLSRFGLQKKIKRLADEASGDDESSGE